MSNPMTVKNYATKLATCRRCGSQKVIWHQGKSGKWYLVDWSGLGIKGENGEPDQYMYVASNFHKCNK